MRKLSLVIIGLIAISTLWAAPISRKQAQQTALQFLQQKGKQQTTDCKLAVKKVRQAETEESCYYYVFNAGHAQGYVVVSGDDRTDAILGYADEGELNPDNMPDNMRAWLDSYADQIKWMDEHNYQPTAEARSEESNTKSPIAPLLTSIWNQSDPFNLLCPTSNNKHTVTGCVATAMAQVMYYHRQPQAATEAIPAYTTKTLRLSIAGLSSTTFDWEHMKDDYNNASSSLSDASNRAVATLMQYCGVAIKMDYGLGENGGSAAYTEDVPKALISYFGYDKDTKFAYRNDYSYQEWVNLMYNELSRGPVLYSGQSAGGGHAFVCDGYAEDDYFHINWGWGGNSNGYFKLSILSPSSQGIGGSSTNDGYGFSQGAMVNVHPQDDGIDDPYTDAIVMTTSHLTVNKYHFTRSSAQQNFTIKTYLGARNKTGDTHSFQFGLALYQNKQLVKILKVWNIENLQNGWGWDAFEGDVSLGANLPDGEYQILSVSHELGTDVVSPNINAERHYIIANINGNNLDLEVVNDCNISATLQLAGEAVVNTPVTIEATVKCKGSDYSGDLVLYRSESSGNNTYYTRLAGLQLEKITQGDSYRVAFTFTPQSTGTFNLVICDKMDNNIGTKSIQVKSGTSSSNPTYLSTAIQGLSNGKIYGSTVHLKTKFKNTSATDFNGTIFYALADYDAGVYTQAASVPVSIEAGKTEEIDFQFDNLTIGHKHQVFYFNYNSNYYSTSFTTQRGIDTYLSDGTKQTIAPSSTVMVADNVVALDISKLTTVSKVVPNSNPNTLYFVNGSKQPTGLDDKNVVKNNTAATLTLTDGYDFFAPIEFTATEATFTRSFAASVNNGKGWSSLILPFEPTAIKQGSQELDWTRSSEDSTKALWLLEFVADNNTGVVFDYAESLQANTPYVLGLAANNEANNLINKPITFSAANALIQASPITSVTGDHFKFCGTTTTLNNSYYALNAEGNNFVWAAEAEVAPFRAYFVNRDETEIDHLPIDFDPQPSLGVESVSQQQEENKQFFNLQGQRIAQPRKGLYIKRSATGNPQGKNKKILFTK